MENLVAKKQSSMIEKSLDDILQDSVHIVLCSIPSALNNVAEQVMLDLLCKSVIGATLDRHIANLVDTVAAADTVSNNMLVCTFMTPILTFVIRKGDTTMEEKKSSTPFSTKD